ncbi:MAG: CinA family protein [Methyloligellaceae bacterium]
MFSDDLIQEVTDILEKCRSNGLKLATAESCTGGLISALLTEIAGSSDVFDRGFVTYSNGAKTDLLQVSPDTLARHGAVSEPTAREMARGALKNSGASVAIAVTGIAGPGGGSATRPVGLVHIAGLNKAGTDYHEACQFGDIGRGPVRQATVRQALHIINKLIQ